jgi:hypothetical protein
VFPMAGLQLLLTIAPATVLLCQAEPDSRTSVGTA